jgi:predicted GH43/DUF377 family glycosyl hydrolase
MAPEDKDAALLPHRIGDYWALIHRPVSAPRAHMWISYSSDLKHWGSHKLFLEAIRGGWWDANKIGLSPPPIKTPHGWLVIYHGVRLSYSTYLITLRVKIIYRLEAVPTPYDIRRNRPPPDRGKLDAPSGRMVR